MLPEIHQDNQTVPELEMELALEKDLGKELESDLE